MDTIISYLNNMFATLPQTPEISRIKSKLLATMEEKYEELKREGKMENEAIGIVISEFGNISELVGELGIDTTVNGSKSAAGIVTDEQAHHFLQDKRKGGLLVAIGVSLCMIGVSLLILLPALMSDGLFGVGLSNTVHTMIGLVALFALLVPAIALFIYSGQMEVDQTMLEHGFMLPDLVREKVQQQQAAYALIYRKNLIIGVCLCVLSPIILFIFSIFEGNVATYGVVLLLWVVTVAVFLFIYSGTIRESFNQLLKTGNFSREKRAANKLIGTVGMIVWPLSVCIFLITGFVFNQWAINWLIFPITALLFGIFCAVYGYLRK